MKNVGLILFFSVNILNAAPLRLHLSYYPTISAAGIYLAQERGWYKKAGIELVIDFKDLNISQKVIDGSTDFALHSAHEVMRTVDNGHDVKAFAADYQLNPLALAAKPEFKKLESLKGKVIGIFTDQEKDFLKVMFASVGLGLNDFTFRYIKKFSADDLINDLKSSKFDAIPVWEFNHPLGFALKGYNVRQFPSYHY